MRSTMFVLLTVLLVLSFAQVPKVISFQGRLADTLGTPVPDADYNLTFKLYDVETGGVALWTELQTVHTANGLFSAMLGSLVELDITDFSDSLWLGIRIGEGTELTPRYKFGSSPYAFHSIYADSALYAIMADHASGADEADVAYAIDWSDITSMPAGFADGIDDESAGTSYTAGEGIDITSDVISVADAGITAPKLHNMGASDGQVMKWNAVASQWQPANDIGGGIGDDWGSQVVEHNTTLSGDGTIGNPLLIAQQSALSGQVLKWNGATWLPSSDLTGAMGALNDLTDVNASAPLDGQVIKWNSIASEWQVANDIGGGIGDDWGSQVVEHDATLSGDGTIGSPLLIAQQSALSGQVLKWNGATWLPSSDLTGAMGALDDITDVNAPAPLDGQVIKWNSIAGEWQAANDIGGGIGDDWGSQVVQTDATLSGDGTIGNPLLIAQQAASSGQVLKWDGATWSPANDETGGGTDSDWQISGDNMYAIPSGNVGIGTTTPSFARLEVTGGTVDGIIVDSPAGNGININNAGGDGMEIWNPGGVGLNVYLANDDGIYIYNPVGDGIEIEGNPSTERGMYIHSTTPIPAPDTGIVIRNTAYHGIYIDSVGYEASGDGIRINKPKDDGVEIFNPNYGVYVNQSVHDGIYISNSGDNGVKVTSPSDDGIYISNPGNDGMEIAAGESTECGIRIHDASGVGDPDTGIIIRDVKEDGIYIENYGQGGSLSSCGIEIVNGDGNGIHIDNPSWLGVAVVYSTNDALRVEHAGTNGLEVSYSGDDGIRVQYATGYAGYFVGTIYATGASAGIKSFLIDHPSDPLHKLLRHYSVESPEVMLIYRGKIKLDETGTGKVAMPQYFIDLADEQGTLVQLTPIGKPFLTGYDWDAKTASVTVYGDPNREVSYQVSAERDDPVKRLLFEPIEAQKGEGIYCPDGELLLPEAYGYPEEMGRGYRKIDER